MATDTFKTLRDFTPSPGKKGRYHSLAALEAAGLGKISRLPRSIRVVLEALVRHCDGKLVTEEFNLRRIQTGKDADPTLQKGDRVEITTAN